MKILFFITGLGYGGAETETVNLALELKSRGYNISFVTIITPFINGYEAQLKKNGITVHSLHVNQKLKLPLNILRLINIIKLEKPAVLHAQMYAPNILSRLLKTFTGKYFLINTIQNTIEGGMLRKIAYKFTKNIPDFVSHVSRRGYNNYVSNKLIKKETSEFIPNAVSMISFEEINDFDFHSCLDIPKNAFVFLAVARLEKQKDYPTLFKAVYNLKNSIDRPFVVCIAGIGSLDEELRELAKEMGLQNHIHFLGLRKDVPSLMKGADCFIMSSEWEGTSLSLLEAMAASLPAVVTNAGDNEFVVQNGLNGFVSEVSNPKELEMNMHKILTLPVPELKRMAEKSKEIALLSFNRQTITDKWVSIYQTNLP